MCILKHAWQNADTYWVWRKKNLIHSQTLFLAFLVCHLTPKYLHLAWLLQINVLGSSSIWTCGILTLAGDFYNVRNESSFNMSKSSSKNLSNEDKHTLSFQRIGNLIHVLTCFWRCKRLQLKFQFFPLCLLVMSERRGIEWFWIIFYFFCCRYVCNFTNSPKIQVNYQITKLVNQWLSSINSHNAKGQ